MNHKDLVTLLKENDLTVSHQRLSILDYLSDSEEHPTCEMIYTGLKNSGHSTLSRATVYNNIKAFVNAGIVHELEIGDHERRYDMDTEEHSHFFCRNCGEIVNLELDHKVQTDLQDNLEAKAPGYVVERKSVNFTGLCPTCYKAQENAREHDKTKFRN
mgnify:CR=1 FL=1